MRKYLLALALPAVILASCNKKAGNENSDTAVDQAVVLNERLEMAQDSKDSLIFLMSDIYSVIEEINVQEGLLYNLRGTDNGTKRSEIIDNLARIKSELQAKQARLDELTQQFNATNDKSGQLAKEVARLKTVISQNEAKITELTAQLQTAHQQINELNDKVATTEEQVKTEVAAKEEAINEVNVAKAENEKLVNDANRVYYAIGTKKELEKNKILHKKKLLQGDYNSGYFKQADRRSLNVIPCYNKKVKVLSNQPADSYRIETLNDGTKSIVITNAARFWGTTDFLIIQVG